MQASNRISPSRCIKVCLYCSCKPLSADVLSFFREPLSTKQGGKDETTTRGCDWPRSVRCGRGLRGRRRSERPAGNDRQHEFDRRSVAREFSLRVQWSQRLRLDGSRTDSVAGSDGGRLV